MTGQEAKDKVYADGLTLRQWAEKHGFDYQTVSRIVSGSQKGNYGKGREIAIKLGMKSAARVAK